MSASGSLVSVILPVHDGGRWLGGAIESVLAQRHRPLELLVVDDASTDGGADIAARYAARHPEVRLLRRERNEGPAAARNAGLSAARGELVTFLDADDRMLAGRLPYQAGFLERRPDVDVLIGRAENVVAAGVEPPPGVARPRDGAWRTHAPMTMMARASVFAVAGGFDVSYGVGEDTDWLLRAGLAGARVERVDRVLIRRLFHGANLSYREDARRRALRRAVLGVVRRHRAAKRSRPRPPA